jgi:DNA ligase 1
MKEFARLIEILDQTNKTNAKVEALADYFRVASGEDRIWALAILLGRRARRTIRLNLLWEWTQEAAGLPGWLMNESYHVAGDLAETIALLLPRSQSTSAKPLSYYMQLITGFDTLGETEKRQIITSEWDSMSYYERFVFIKLITGGFRIGVSQNLVVKALSSLLGIDANLVTHRLMGAWSPFDTDFDTLLNEEASSGALPRPYPFYLAYALDLEAESLGPPQEWQAEWKWDGIRAQLIKTAKGIYIWSRGEELVTDKFPELSLLENRIPEGTVIDGEILAYRNNAPLPFGLLQTRIGRKNVSQKTLQQAPVAMIAYDLLEHEGQDIRHLPFAERRRRLETLVKSSGHPSLILAEPLSFTSWEELARIRERSREHFTEGVMLKRLDSVYETGRRRGSWWKWKINPLSIDAVLIYAQKGHGRRANLYTDYTFGVWDKGKLIPFAKAYSGLTDKEILEVDAFIRKNTGEKFGPVRTVLPELVFEIAFEGINRSTRHKSGVALRFPRILRWRKDKKAEEADTLDHLKELLRQYGSAE